MAGLVVAAALVAIVAAGCGGGSGSDSQVASLGPSAAASTTADPGGATTSASGNPRDTVLEFTKCMRANGVDIPDPNFSQGGNFSIGPGRGSGANIDPGDPKFRAAMDKCRPILQSIQQQISPEQRQAFQDAALEFAQCMRSNGVDIPDPDFSQGPGGQGGFGFFAGPGGGPNGNINPGDPKFRAASEKCQSVFDDLRDRFGPPGGGGTTTGDGN